MKYGNEPQLLMIEGDQQIGVVWTTAAAGAAKIGTRIGKRIAAVVRGKRARREKAAQAKRAEQLRQIEITRARDAEITRQKADTKNRNLMIAAIAAAAAIPIVIMIKK